MELLKRNEIESNRVAARVMRITAAIFLLVYILDIVGIFVVDIKVMTIAYILGSLCLWLPTLLVNGLKLRNGAIKYVCVLCAVIFVTLMTVTLTYHAVVMYVFAIAVASLYFSKPLTIFAAILTVIGTAVGQIAAFNLDTVQDHNFTEMYKVLVFGVAPRALSLIAVAAIFAMLSGRTAKMLGSLMSAEQQEIMREKTAEVSGKLLDTVTELERISTASASAGKTSAEESSAVARDCETNFVRIQEITDSMTIVAENLNKVSGMCEKISGLSKGAENAASENDKLISGASDVLEQVCKSGEDCKEIIAQLSEQSGQIEGIVKIITDISMQTNILSLNASVEAAHAGERGKGFSVVAEEIRKLSGQTKTAAQEIGDVIEEVACDISQTVKLIENNSALTRESMDKMAELRESARHISHMSSGISKHMENMSGIIGGAAESGGNVTVKIYDVNESIQKSGEAVRRTAAAAEENSAAAEELGSMVKNILQMSEELKVITEG